MGPKFTQQIKQSSLKLRLYIVLSTVFSMRFQSALRWMNSYTSYRTVVNR